MSTIAYAPIRWLSQEWDRGVRSARPSGIVGDLRHRLTGGYHISREDQPSGNYSVSQYAADRRGPSNAASAIDMTMSRADMILISKRLLAAAKARDPRLVKYVRAFNGTTTGDRAIRVEIGHFGLFSATPDHTWHVHLEIYRAYANDMTAMRAILDVILGRPAVAKPKPPAPKPPAPRPAPKPAAKLRRAWPKYMPTGHYFGLLSGPNASHGGFYAAERADVRAIQQRLQALGYAPKTAGWADGKYEAPTKAAVAAWQRKAAPKTTSRPGEVWPDDWRRLFTY